MIVLKKKWILNEYSGGRQEECGNLINNTSKMVMESEVEVGEIQGLLVRTALTKRAISIEIKRKKKKIDIREGKMNVPNALNTE